MVAAKAWASHYPNLVKVLINLWVYYPYKGFRIALDDFGMGYSSISHLISYPIDIVKLDKSMQSLDGENNKRLKIIESLSLMLKKLDFFVVAEGIETKAQHQLCKKLNIDYLQGFLFSKPMPANEINLILDDYCKKSSLNK